MSYSKKELSNYRIEKAKEALKDARTLAATGSWNSTANRLYYSCFYAAIAYLILQDSTASTHSGVKNHFSKTLIKSGKLTTTYGELYQNLFDLRHDADYRDYNDMNQAKIEPLVEQVDQLLAQIEKLIASEF